MDWCAMSKHKIYCFNNGGSPGWLHAVALADDGHCLAQHVCSHEDFMAHDLGIVGTRKHENYDAHFGAGNWELDWIADPHDSRLEAALALNKALPREEAAADYEQTKAGVSATFSDGTTVERYL